TVVPSADCTVTLGWIVNGDPAAAFPGWRVNANFVAGLGATTTGGRACWDAAIPTVTWPSPSERDEAEPKKCASPKEKTPPSEATRLYPCPVGLEVMPTIGWLRVMAPVDPWNCASPNEKMPPSEATIQ